MKRLTIKRLILISQSESRSLEVPFKNGLNIILGGNKTGKSSIIKSIFTTLGCECKSVESDWKNLFLLICYFSNMVKNNFVLFDKERNFKFLSVSIIPIVVS